MISILDRRLRLCDGISRREAMSIGGVSALGLAMPMLNARPALAGDNAVPRSGSAKSVILFWLSGGPPQHETWDPKPDAPSDIRGDYGTISTPVPGLQIGELMPQTAKLIDHIAVLRAVVSNDNAHSSSGYQMLTGVPHQPRNLENATAKKPNLHPSLGAMVRKFLPDSPGLPSAVTLPRHIANTGEIVWPGQDAGFMGHRYDPWLITCDPSAADFHPPVLDLPEGLSAERFHDRRRLLQELNQQIKYLPGAAEVAEHAFYDQQAYQLVSEGGSREAFNLEQESAKVRDRYGRTKFAQSVLLARRLVERGVRLVQVNWQQIEGKPNFGSWDTHAKHSECLKDHLMPIMDQSYSALLEDLLQRGMLQDTLVAWVGEFGHTPKFNKNAGRDHWGRVFSVALAGGGIQGGRVFGRSDKIAGDPVSGRLEPQDITATILHCLGLSPSLEYHDDKGRPLPLSRGNVIEAIL